MKTQVKTRFLLLSDTHSALPVHAIATNLSKEYAYAEPLPEADVAIHTGDLTYNGKKEEHEAAIQLLKSITAPLKIVIPGNHDLTLDNEYYAKKGNLWGPNPKYNDQEIKYIRSLYTNAEARTNGIHYMEEGTHTFHLKNGAILTVYASAYTPEFCQWAFAYPRSKDRYNANGVENLVPSFTTTPTVPKQNDQPDDNGDDFSQSQPKQALEEPLESRNIDVILTHGPPLTILDKTLRHKSVGCKHLLTATTRARPLLHCFGHIHEGWGAMRKTWPPLPTTATDTNVNTAGEYHKQQQELGNIPGQEITAIISNTDTNTNTNWVNIDSQDDGDQSKTKTWQVSTESVVRDHGCFVDATDLKRGEETVFVNAAIMDINYKPTQAPFIIDLMLDGID